jgi:myo-inositol-1(or 4)-monophosphatase
MSELDPRALRDAAVAMAREAGAILMEGHGRLHAPERKGRIDLVTEFDRRAERLVLSRIAERFPGHAVLAEESGRTGDVAAAPACWLVDPLDGTTNFAHNYPFFAVSIAVEVARVLVAAAVYDPVRDEMYAAARGDGAALNQTTLRVSEIARVEEALVVTGFPYAVREQPDEILADFRAFLLQAQGVRRDGSAALNLSYVASGRFDGMWEVDLAPWDMAAGVLIIREAGGRVTRYDGGRFALDGREILASNGRVHEEMIGILGGAR